MTKNALGPQFAFVVSTDKTKSTGSYAKDEVAYMSTLETFVLIRNTSCKPTTHKHSKFIN